MNKDCMSVERAVYYRLFLVQGLTERFDRDLDERLERENPLSDLTLALSTCGGKREEQVAQFADVSLPLNDEQIEAMRKRIDEFNRAETRISKTAMPELREAMALYLVEHLAEEEIR